MATYRGLQKFSHKKKKRRVAGRQLRIVGIFFLGFLLCAGVYYATSDAFQVSDIKLTGLSETPEVDVRQRIDALFSQKILFFIPANAIWLVDTAALARDLETEFPTIERATVNKSWPKGIDVVIQEYSGWGVLCHGDPEECFWIDRAGVAFDHAPGFSGLIVPKIRDLRNREFTLGQRQLSAKLMNIITYFDERASSNTYLQSLIFTIDAENQTIRMTTRAGWDVLLLEDTDPTAAYKNLTIALNEEIQSKARNLAYIDLRFGNRIFYKFKE